MKLSKKQIEDMIQLCAGIVNDIDELMMGIEYDNFPMDDKSIDKIFDARNTIVQLDRDLGYIYKSKGRK